MSGGAVQLLEKDKLLDSDSDVEESETVTKGTFFSHMLFLVGSRKTYISFHSQKKSVFWIQAIRILTLIP